MPYNGIGVFEGLAPPVYPAVDGEVIEADYFNQVMQDLFDGLSNAVTRDGQSAPTAHLPMGGFRHTGCAPAVLPDQYATLGQIVGGDLTWAGGHNFVQNADPNILNPSFYDTFKVSRTSDTAAIGANPNVRGALLVDVKVVDGTNFFEWGVISRVSIYDSAGTGEHVAITGQGFKYTANGKAWGGVLQAHDYSGNAGNGILNALELNVFANGNPAGNGRVGTTLVMGKADTGLAQNVVRAAMEVSPAGLDKSTAKLLEGFKVQLHCDGGLIVLDNAAQADSLLDTRTSAGIQYLVRLNGVDACYVASSVVGISTAKLRMTVGGVVKYLPLYDA